MKTLLSCVALGLCIGVAGCAGPGASSRTAAAATPVTSSSAREAIAPGKSTKADVLAALGKTVAVNFDSGYEVWVYRLDVIESQRAEGVGASEFVVLFDPSGVVTKTRIRHAPPSVEGNRK